MFIFLLFWLIKWYFNPKKDGVVSADAHNHPELMGCRTHDPEEIFTFVSSILATFENIFHRYVTQTIIK